MKLTFRHTLICLLLATALLIGLLFVYLNTSAPATKTPAPDESVSTATLITRVATSTHSVIGTSTLGQPIYTYTFGTGTTHILFVGGIHGGYEWNTILLAYQTIDAFYAGTLNAPPHQTIHIIPSLNPDGARLVVGSGERFLASAAKTVAVGTGRFNANNVDLNRNFDCRWQTESTWRGQPVSAGSQPFSEIESRLLRDYVLEIQPVGVVMWHSQGNAVYGSECEVGILATTSLMVEAYAGAASYTPFETFDAYPVTGDAEGWLASIGIPAITVELETRTATDWERNYAGLTAIMELW